MHDVGASMRRDGPFEFVIPGHACFTPTSRFYKITKKYILISNRYMNAVALWLGVEDEQKSKKA